MNLGGTGSLRSQPDNHLSEPAPRLSPNLAELAPLSSDTVPRSSNRHHLSFQFHCEHCGKQYSALHHLESHQRGLCHASKRKLSDLLASTKEFWETRKKRRSAEEAPSISEASNCSVDVTVDHPVNPRCSEVPEDLDDPLSTRRTRRQSRLPARYRQEDVLPQALPVVNEAEDEPVVDVVITDREVAANPTLVVHKSRRNNFGIMRAYRIPRGSVLTHDPDRAITLWDLTEGRSTPAKPTSTSESTPTPTESTTRQEDSTVTPKESALTPSSVPSNNRQKSQWGPFPNKSSFSLADWYWDSKNKSFADFQKLLAIFKQPDFLVSEVVDVNWKYTFKALGANREDLPDHEAEWIHDDGWTTTPVSIEVPLHHRMRQPGLETYFAGNFRHRRIVSVIKEKISNTKDAPSFHYQPYQATWKPTDEGPEVELHGELYASRAFREAHEEIQTLPTTHSNEGLERVVVAMMIWSDGTQLTSFGGASLWPCYLFFGNESKYRRCQPSERLGEQIAYFIKARSSLFISKACVTRVLWYDVRQLPDDFDDYLRQRNDGKLPTDGLYAHCAREMFQKQWGIMLDDELMDAMKHGLVLLCPDGRRRCFYPRIFTYSADYPEKQTELWKLGSPIDTEREDSKRNEVEQKTKVDLALAEIAAGFAVDGTRIDRHLKSESLVPVHNAFSARLNKSSFRIIPALTVDLMHEFEIGVWKKLFIHLIRLLEAFASLQPQGSTLTADLDYRFRKTPPFGRDNVRSFSQNSSEMKRRAARDYEDLLQCSIPAFDSLLPEPHNASLMKLLYIYAQWHALAKLRMHHDHTLQLLEYTTTWLGAQTRLFNHNTCSRIVTKELQKESEAREKREGNGNGKGSTRKPVKFNIFTIKFHFLGDYIPHIKLLGTTDSYSTETGELFHRLPKSWFERTDKRDYETQLSQVERRRARLDEIRHTHIRREVVEDGPAKEQAADEAGIEDSLEQPGIEGEAEDSPDLRYWLGANRSSPIDIAFFSCDPSLEHKDPYLVNFIQKLKEHLLPRIISRLGFSDSTFEQVDWADVALTRLYSHKLLRVNYTTYDVRRDQDVIHVGTPQSSIMLLNGASTQNSDPLYASVHPYLYAKVLGIYHANVSYVGRLPDGTQNPTAHRIDFAWVHWYDILDFGKEFTLDRLAFRPIAHEDALDFVDPSDIIRSVHLIPQFSLGPPSTISRAQKSKCFAASEDVWDAFYINKFADRDLFMRYQYGMAVGHTYMRKMHPSRMVVPSIPPDFNHCLSFTEDTDVGPGDYVEPLTDISDDEEIHDDGI